MWDTYTQQNPIQYEKRGNPAIVTIQMNLEDIMLKEISQAQEDKYCMISLCMWNVNKPNSQKLIMNEGDQGLGL